MSARLRSDLVIISQGIAGRSTADGQLDIKEYNEMRKALAEQGLNG